MKSALSVRRRASPSPATYHTTPSVVSHPFDYLEITCLMLVTGLVGAGWLALTLAVFGVYHPAIAVIGGIGALAISGWLLRRRSRHSTSFADVFGLTIPVVLGLALFFPPDEWILGALDPGSYVNAGAAIAKSGSLIQHSSLLASIPKNLRDALFPFPASRLPGFYLTAGQFDGVDLQGFFVSPDRVVPHGFHLYPVILSLGFAIGGIKAELLITPVLAILAIGAFYLLVRRLFGNIVAAIASVFLVLGPAEIWFARYPDAEILTQFLLFGGLLAFVMMHELPSWPLAFLSGAALGAVHLAKIETLPLPFILGGYFGYRAILGDLKREWLGFLAGYLPLTLQAAILAYFVSTWYTITTFDKSLPAHTLFAILAAAGIVGLAALALIVNRPLRISARYILRHPAGDAIVGIIAPLAIGFLAIYAYYIRPMGLASIVAGSAPLSNLAVTNDLQSFVRLGWYITPLGILLGTLGWMLIARFERRQETLLVLAFIAADTVLYLTHMYITPVHYWAARRWVPLVIPGFALAAAYFLHHLFQLRKRTFDVIMPAGLGLIMLAGLVGASHPLFGYVEYRGAIDQMQALAAVFPSNAIVLFPDGDAGQRFSVPLEYIYSRTSVDVLAGTEAAAGKAAQIWLAQGHPVYWVTTAEQGDPSAIGAHGTIVGRQRISLPEKIATRDTRPGADGLFQQDLIIWRLEPGSARSQTP